MSGAQIPVEKGNFNNACFLAQSFENQPDSVQFAPVTKRAKVQLIGKALQLTMILIAGTWMYSKIIG